MIDVGLKVEVDNSTSPIGPAGGAVTTWRQLTDIAAMPALIQPSAKIATDFIGDEFTGEMLGKRAVTGLNFTFAYDGGGTGKQFRFLSDLDDDNAKRWMRVTYPDGTKFEMYVDFEVTLVAPTPSGEIDYTLAVTPNRHTVATPGSTRVGDLVVVIYPDETDPLASSQL